MVMLHEFLKSKLDGVYCVGHASYLGRFSGRLYLFDPLWNNEPYGGYWTLWPEQIDLDSLLPEIAGCFVSHIHEDHLCNEILSKLTCPIYVMSGRKSMNEAMKRYKFTRFIDPWQKFIVDGNEAFFIPHAFNSIDSSIAIRSKTFSFYHGNDNFLSYGLAVRAKSLIGELDVAAVPYAFVHYYPALLTDVDDAWKKAETDRLVNQSMKQAIDTAFVLDAKFNIPCGASLFYKDRIWNALNESIKTPFQFQRSIKNAVPIVAGGFILESGATGSSITSNEIYRAGLADYLRSFQVRHTNYKIKITCARFSRLVNKLDAAPVTGIDHTILIPYNDTTIAIHLKDNSLTKIHDASQAYTMFKFETRELEQWLDGEISFEQLLGTRRFTYSRRPNEYNLNVMEWYNNYL